MAKDTRLQKMLADCGVASRRKAEEMIQAGLVTVNGETAHIGDKVDPRRDRVAVKGRPVQPRSKNVYIMLHKPRGYITTMSDEMGRRCVAELVKEIPERIYPVGRLDRDSEGLLLMTNDGAFANLHGAGEKDMHGVQPPSRGLTSGKKSHIIRSVNPDQAYHSE